ncbi:MAG: Inorganic diphosphatase PpaC [uncultured bacterium]|nr:MAG: Inorganic diphosphatase PpaC [uncultured bacterium]
MKIYILGHISPDLDSIASAVEYAEYLKKTNRYKDAQLIPLAAETPNKETQFIFDKFGVELPKLIDDIEIEQTDSFILVDHNEEAQRSPKIPSGKIIEIIDHHKINITFEAPLRIDVKPLGSTSSLIYDHFETAGIKPTKEVQGLVISAILSDTQGLKSSTTTGYDSEIAHKIAKDADIDIEKLTFEIFRAKSDITGMTAFEIVTKDVKVYEMASHKVFIGVIETVEPQKVLEQKQALIEALSEVKPSKNVDMAYLFVVDILKSNSIGVFSTEEEGKILEKAFVGKAENGTIDIGPRTVRKKDIAPEIERAIKQAK